MGGMGELTWEPFQDIKKDNPITLARHAQEQGLLEQAQWRWANDISKTTRSFRGH
jgi:hypothetical protein